MLDTSTGYVRQLLRNELGSVNFIHIQTEPGLPGRVVTVVRGTGSNPWTEQHLQQITGILATLPDADVRPAQLRDRIVVIWTGMPVEQARA